MSLRHNLLHSVFNGPNLVGVASWHARPNGLPSLMARREREAGQ